MNTAPRPRRKGLRIVVLSSVFSFVMAFGLSFWLSGESELPRRDFDWIVACYMSYDNSLHSFGSTIINELYKGLQNDRVLVSVLGDFADNYGLRRIQMTDGYYKEDVITATDNSADPNVVRDYFQWLSSEFNAKKYVISFLNCGGRVNQMNLDCSPGEETEPLEMSHGWLDPKDVGKILANFHNDSMDIELLFLQQPGRGSIENLYCFRDSADYIVATTLGIDAPNAYYKKTIGELCQSPAETTTGADVAELIMRHEKDDQFHNYICYDTAVFPELIVKMRNYARLWPKGRRGNAGAALSIEPDLIVAEERVYDIVKLLENDDRRQARDIADCIQNRFVVSSRVSSEINCECGPPALLTTLVPDVQYLIYDYRNHPIYRETEWNRFTFNLLNK